MWVHVSVCEVLAYCVYCKYVYFWMHQRFKLFILEDRSRRKTILQEWLMATAGLTGLPMLSFLCTKYIHIYLKNKQTND